MSTAFLGRGLVLAGIVAGILAVSLPFAGETRYVDDGTTAAFLIVLLSFTSLLPAEIGRDLVAAAAGSAAFGFFLVIPSIYAFDSFGSLESGAWLGVCTALIPLGALVVFAADGTTVKVEDERVAKLAGPFACWELFQQGKGLGSAAITELWAQ